jgi:hypothetical protein
MGCRLGLPQDCKATLEGVSPRRTVPRWQPWFETAGTQVQMHSPVFGEP